MISTCLLWLLTPLYSKAQFSSDGTAIEKNYIFYNEYNLPCEPAKASWYRGIPEKNGNIYPFVGYYLTGQHYVYGFYSSLDSGGIKNGYFLFFDTLGTVIREGAYEHDLREGEWRYYQTGSPTLWRSETYDKGRQAEHSEYYPNGHLSRKEVYRQLTPRSKEIVSSDCFDSLGNRMKCNYNNNDPSSNPVRDTVLNTADHNTGNLLNKLDRDVEAKVWVRFRVGLDGYVDQITVIHSTNPKFNLQAAEAVETMPRWKRGTAKGSATFVLPLIFKRE